MARNPVTAGGNGVRSGVRTLMLLSAPLHVHILRELALGPIQQTELRRATGWPAHTTLRAALKRLAEIGVVEMRRRNRFPGVLEHELTPAGQDLLVVVDVLRDWLEQGPDQPLQLGGNPAKTAIKVLAEGWSTAMLRALAARPLKLTELDSLISALSYPSIERRLSAMRLVGQVEAAAGNGSGRPYAVTPWLRKGVGPMAVAARWERRHLPDSTASIGSMDIETALLLATPLVESGVKGAGTCRLAATIPGETTRLVGVVVEMDATGAIKSCRTRLNGNADGWALGSTNAWFNAIIEGDVARLELGGASQLARSLVEGLHEALFRVQADGRPTN